MKRRVKEWLKFAEVDLEAVKKLLEDKSLTQAAAFHCQQSIEKSLKAIIEEEQNKIPRTHDLIRLYGILLELNINLSIDEDLLSDVNDVYTETRYPSDIGLLPNGIPAMETVKSFSNLANQVYSTVIAYLTE